MKTTQYEIDIYLEKVTAIIEDDIRERKLGNEFNKLEFLESRLEDVDKLRCKLNEFYNSVS